MNQWGPKVYELSPMANQITVDLSNIKQPDYYRGYIVLDNGDGTALVVKEASPEEHSKLLIQLDDYLHKFGLQVEMWRS